MSWSPSSEQSLPQEAPAPSFAGVELTVPDLGSPDDQATLVDWTKQIGDPVAADEPICRLALGELQFEVRSTAAGTLTRVFATPGEGVRGGDSLAEIAPAADGSELASSEDYPSSDDYASEGDLDSDADYSSNENAASTGDFGSDVAPASDGEPARTGSEPEAAVAESPPEAMERPIERIEPEPLSEVAPLEQEREEPFYAGEPPGEAGEPDLEPEQPEPEPAREPEPAPEYEAKSHELDPELAEPVASPRQPETTSDVKASGDDAVNWSHWHSPVVKMLAEKHGVDLSEVRGTGTGGRIRKRDVIAHIEGAARS